MEDSYSPQNGQHGKRAAVVINPMKSPDNQFKSAVFQLCVHAGWQEPLWLETSEEDPGRGQTREALEAKVDVVIAAGGDGTVRSVAEVLTGTSTAMGLVPLGTGNLLARNMNIDISDPLIAFRGVLEGEEKKIDVIKAVIDHAEQEHLFLVAAGLGYDASIMADTVEELKDRVGWLAYVESGIRKLPGKPATARITIDGKTEIHRKVRGVMVGNCGKLMGGLEIFPNAVATDGILDLLTLAPRGKLGWVVVIFGIFARKSGRNRSVLTFSGKSAEIALDRAQEFQVDGDHLGAVTHLSVAVAPLALTLKMVPAAAKPVRTMA